MKTFVFEPLRGIRDSVQFGMSREEARAALAPERPDPFFRGETSVDGFHHSCLQVSYDAEGRVEFIEFARGLGVLVDGHDILGAEADSVLEHLTEKHGLEPPRGEPGYIFRFLEIELGLWRPVLPSLGSAEGRFFESAGFGRFGYYSMHAQKP